MLLRRRFSFYAFSRIRGYTTPPPGLRKHTEDIWQYCIHNYWIKTWLERQNIFCPFRSRPVIFSNPLSTGLGALWSNGQGIGWPARLPDKLANVPLSVFCLFVDMSSNPIWAKIKISLLDCYFRFNCRHWSFHSMNARLCHPSLIIKSDMQPSQTRVHAWIKWARKNLEHSASVSVSMSMEHVGASELWYVYDTHCTYVAHACPQWPIHTLFKCTLRVCSHITSAKIRGSWTPPPPSVSNGQHLAYPPSSAFAWRPFCTTIFYVDKGYFVVVVCLFWLH